MPGIPECLHRRYRALDELIGDLSSSMSNRSSMSECTVDCTNNPGVKLMCDFWNILKEYPDCNLKNEVERRMGLKPPYYKQRVTCYMADCCKENEKKEEIPEKKQPCGERSDPEPPVQTCCPTESSCATSSNDDPPLSRVLCNLKEAASLDKDCSEQVSDLMETQVNLKKQIQQLEEKEKDGVILLKKADCMWACMEDAYKTKIAESLERQKVILKELKEVEASATKWRKNKKDLEFQNTNVTKCQHELTEKINQKLNDKKSLETEIADFNKRIERNKKDIDAATKSIANKKKASDAKIANITTEIKKLQSKLQEEHKHKQDKEKEGKIYIKEAREDIQKMSSMLLQKTLENEDLKAEKDALILEVEMLKQASEECRDRCENKRKAVLDEIKSLDNDIANFTTKCINCHECVDTSDMRDLCTNCPRCAENQCLYEKGQCTTGPTEDCVCMSVKQKLLENIFDNMYTVLEKEAKNPAGKAVAESVLKCLKGSTNGKLNPEIRKRLQEFILTTIKNNLNVTIIGGAVKTRCEMDPETYQQLLLCLKKVKVTRPPRTDKGTNVKKEPCARWCGSSECNCPKGPKACICTRKVKIKQDDTAPTDAEDRGKCHAKKESNCTDTEAACHNCAMHAVPSPVKTDVVSEQPERCDDSCCPFPKNMKAAQCILGPDSLASVTKSKATPPMPILDFDSQVSCDCGQSTEKSYSKCCQNIRSQPREHIIEEVMGKYTEVTPIEKVSYAILSDESFYTKRRNI